MVDAILMASGFSRRFGEENKLLCPFLGKPLIAHALGLITGISEIRRAIVVAADARVLAIARAYPVEVVENSCPDRGMCESIRLGTRASDARHYLFVPSDQPLLDRETVQTLIARRDGQILHFEGGGLPSLFPAEFREELRAREDGESGRTIMARHPGRVRRIPAGNPLALRDVDTPEDLKLLLKLAKGRTAP